MKEDKEEPTKELPHYKISKGKTTKCFTGQTIEEAWLTIEGVSLTKISKEFDKRWKEK